MRSAESPHFIGQLFLRQHSVRDQDVADRPFPITLDHEQPHELIAVHQPHLDRQLAEHFVGVLPLNLKNVKNASGGKDAFFECELSDGHQLRALNLDRIDKLCPRNHTLVFQVKPEMHDESNCRNTKV